MVLYIKTMDSYRCTFTTNIANKFKKFSPDKIIVNFLSCRRRINVDEELTCIHYEKYFSRTRKCKGYIQFKSRNAPEQVKAIENNQWKCIPKTNDQLSDFTKVNQNTGQRVRSVDGSSASAKEIQGTIKGIGIQQQLNYHNVWKVSTPDHRHRVIYAFTT